MTRRAVFATSLRAVALLLGVLILLRIAYPLGTYVFESANDVGLYERYARGIRATPATWPLEYPPLAVAIFSLPLVIASDHYAVAFGLLAAFAAWLTLLAIVRLSRRGWWLLLLLALGGWGTLFARFDIFVVCLTVLAFACASRRRWLPAQMLLALGVGLKLYPVVLMPLVVVWQWCQRKQPECCATMPTGR